jgi:hypothetical protein
MKTPCSNRLALALLVLAAIPARSTEEPGAAPGEVARLIELHRSIRLTPEQAAIRDRALGVLPAPCCAQYPLATCCCPCNLAKAAWGLAAYRIAVRGEGEAQVRDAVERWLRATNPGGYTGDACFRGGCERPFHENGCGGMDETRLPFEPSGPPSE